jgi:hypothetical protein
LLTTTPGGPDTTAAAAAATTLPSTNTRMHAHSQTRTPVGCVAAAGHRGAQGSAGPQDGDQQAVIKGGQLAQLVAQQQRRTHHEYLLHAHLCRWCWWADARGPVSCKQRQDVAPIRSP